MSDEKGKKDIDKGIVDFYLDTLQSKKLKASMYTISITLTTIFIFGGLGYMLDNYLGATPYIFITLLVLSFPVSQIAVYRKIKELFKK